MIRVLLLFCHKRQDTFSSAQTLLRNPGLCHCHYMGEIAGHYFQVKVPEHGKVAFGWAWALVLLLFMDHIHISRPFFYVSSTELMGMKNR